MRGIVIIQKVISSNQDKITKIRNVVIKWEKENYEPFPWRNTDNKFHALIAEMMLQRTRAEQVVSTYEKFTLIYPDLDTAAKASKEEMRKNLYSLGLNWRIDNIISVINIISTHNEVPTDYDELISLPGIGDYIASAFLIFHFKKCLTLIDSNAVRLWSRVFNLEIKGELRRKKWFRKLVEFITPKRSCRLFNYGVIDISRKFCKPKPLHAECPLRECCTFYRIIIA